MAVTAPHFDQGRFWRYRDRQRASELSNKVEQLAASIEELHNATAARAGLNRTDYRALVFIVRSEGLTAGQLGERVRVTTGAITGVLNRLERSGHAVRGTDAKDRRHVVVRATEKGRREVNAILTALHSEISGILIYYADEDLRIVSEFLGLAAPAVAEQANVVLSTRQAR